MSEINATRSRQASQFTAQNVPCVVSKVLLVIHNAQSKLNTSESVNTVKAQRRKGLLELSQQMGNNKVITGSPITCRFSPSQSYRQFIKVRLKSIWRLLKKNIVFWQDRSPEEKNNFSPFKISQIICNWTISVIKQYEKMSNIFRQNRIVFYRYCCNIDQHILCPT